jgi:hypothetical protein
MLDNNSNPVNCCFTIIPIIAKHFHMEKRTRGRPEIPAEDRKAMQVACRVDADERAQLDQAADKAGIRLSDWMRERLLSAAKRELRKGP